MDCVVKFFVKNSICNCISHKCSENCKFLYPLLLKYTMNSALIIVVVLVVSVVVVLLTTKKTVSKQAQQQLTEPFNIYTYRDEDFNIKQRFDLDCPVDTHNQRAVDIDLESQLVCCVFRDKEQADTSRCNYQHWCSTFCEDKSTALVAMCVRDKSLQVCKKREQLSPEEFLKNEWTLSCRSKYSDDEMIQQCTRIGVASKKLPGSSVIPQTQRICSSTLTTNCINPGVL